MSLKSKISALFIFFSLQSNAQLSFDESKEKTMESILENAVEEIDYSELESNEHELKSIQLNQAEYLDLYALKMLNSELVQAILQHRTLYGHFESIYELQTVEGFDSNLIQLLIPHIHIGVPLWNFSFNRQFAKMTIQFSSAYRFEHSYGYSRKDSLQYMGSPLKYRWNIRASQGENIQFGIHGEKDAGESMNYSFLSAYLRLHSKGKMRSCILGDQQLGYGQGLCLGSGMPTGATGMLMSGVIQRNGAKPYNSSNETGFIRGGSLELKISNKMDIYIFSGFRLLDSKSTIDSLGNTMYGSINYNGYYRNSEELEKRHSLRQSLSGIHMAYTTRSIKFGSTALQFNTHEGSGLKFGADWMYNRKNYIVYGELTYMYKLKPSCVTGIAIAIGKRCDVNLLYRNYRINKGSIFSNAFTGTSGLTNENGLYSGFGLQVFKKWGISAYNDLLVTYQNADRLQQSIITEQFIECSYKTKEKFSFTIRYKPILKQPDYGLISGLLASNHYKKHTLRLHMEYTIDNWRFRNRFEHCLFDNFLSQPFSGMQLYHDIQKEFGKSFRINARFTVFDSEQFGSRTFAFENDISGTYTIQSFTGKGIRYYFLFQWKMNKDLHIWIRFARSIYDDRSTIGSGSDLINSNRKSDINCQLQWNLN